MIYIALAGIVESLHSSCVHYKEPNICRFLFNSMIASMVALFSCQLDMSRLLCDWVLLNCGIGGPKT